MGIFHYRDMDAAEAANLAQISHSLAAYSQLGPVLNIPLADIVNVVGAILPNGTLT